MLGLLLRLLVVKDTRHLARWWKDMWAPLTYASVGNFDDFIVYSVCAEALGLPEKDEEMKLMTYQGKAQRTEQGWLLLDAIQPQNDQTKKMTVPFACEITGESVDYMEVKTILLKQP
ncbi:hypothetical protein D3875_17030 [Deinococcus cavernae]|uniref:Uncharacterized protein n=1 Tax=Deinococcus cavernae TaxID=2320857 RepID=A0A418VAC7_9DEIO|nr:hypothetical protein [Deinococcus cavernae]RJF72992.1 hypothetical protein D3875_17030 [Deinococcus cavernae]